LRGGFPVSVSAASPRSGEPPAHRSIAGFDHASSCVYMYARKHGDLERDYNRFQVAPTYFSQGDGNYRDVNQNRRCDVLFHPAVGDRNVRSFFNLIQPDGYNPLVLRGERFVIAEEVFLADPLAQALPAEEAKKLARLLAEPFEIGDVFRHLEDARVPLSMGREDFASGLLGLGLSVTEASHGEGYWIDHWTYNTDLLESYAAVFPDRLRGLLFEDATFTYFDTHVFVRPRSERIVIDKGRVCVRHALEVNDEKDRLIRGRGHDRHLVRTQDGAGEILRTTLAAKIVCVLLNKLASLDPEGVGVEMEAEKPDWYDALNGLPALFGSSISETYEIKRLILKMRAWAEACGVGSDFPLELPAEVGLFFDALHNLLEEKLPAYEYWDRSNAAKEAYRHSVRRCMGAGKVSKTWGACDAFFDKALAKLDQGLAKARLPGKKGLLTTYFSYVATGHDPHSGGPVKVRGFGQKRLPLFLEGFVHAMRCDGARAATLYAAVKKSALYDQKLGMYKVNASLKDESFELGRCKAFTAGWLENESIWLHMEYKFLLELLRNGLYNEFYKEMDRALVPFQAPEVYGRSILENSSFIVSSAHPDASLHGQGFVARLSGSTAEFLHIWFLMNLGPRPFFLDGGALKLRLAPALPGRFFTKTARRASWDGGGLSIEVPRGGYAFLFLGRTPVVYRNAKRKNTFGSPRARVRSVSLVLEGGCVHHFAGDTIPDPYAAEVRAGRAVRIEADLA
ncbi:MAG: hypothetical protein ACM3L6_05550, partial [Deltaproteobacteria bacterium]